MENLFSYKKKTKTSETKEEFYLNSRDSFLNGKPLNYNSIIYLPVNEILIILFEEQFIFVDIKTSIIDSMKIIKFDQYTALYEKLFPKQSKIDNNNLQKEQKSNSNKQNKENKSGEVKNDKRIDKIVPIFNRNNDKINLIDINIIESKYKLNDFVIMVLFNNYEIGILNYKIEYLNSKQTKIDVIYASKCYSPPDTFAKTRVFGMKSSSEWDLFYTKLIKIQNSSEGVYIEKRMYENILFGVYKNEQIDIYILIRKYESQISLSSFNIQPLIKFDLNYHVIRNISCNFQSTGKKSKIFICLNSPDSNIDIIEMELALEATPSKPFKNLIKPKETNLQTINIKNFDNIYYENINFAFAFKFGLSRITYEENIINTFISFEVIFGKIYLLIAKLNKVYIYTHIQNQFVLVKQILFEKFYGSMIAYAFLTKFEEIYVFDRFSNFSKEKTSYDSQSFFKSNHEIFPMRLSNEVYGIEKMQSGFGFFILSVKNIVKFSDMILEVLLIREEMYKKGLQDYYENLIKNDNEIIIKNCNELIFLLKKNFLVLDKKIKSLMNYKLLYFNALISSKEENVNLYKNQILIELKNKLRSKSLIKENNQICEFCEKILVKFNDIENVFYCENNHPNYVCYLTKQKINDNSLECEKCSVFYNMSALEEFSLKSFYICFICQSNLY